MNPDDFPALHALSQEMVGKVNPEGGRKIFSAAHSMLLANRYGADYQALDYYHNPHLRTAHTMEAVNELLPQKARALRSTVATVGRHGVGYANRAVVAPVQAAAARRRSASGTP
jgi:hypothetical protein